MCNIRKLSNVVYQFNGFSFYNSLEKSNYWSQHTHEEIQIVLPQNNAQAWMQSQGSTGKLCTQQIKSGESFLVASNQSHSLDWQQRAELTIFYLHPRFLEKAIADSLCSDLLEMKSPFLLVNDTLIQEVGVIFRHLCSHNAAKEKLYLESLANLLAVHLLKKYLNYDFKIVDHHQGLPRKKLKLVLDYIEANLEQKIELSDLANLADVGRFYFCRLFKESMAISPYKYVVQQRILRAKKLLKSTDLSICDISFECGFSNQSNLAKHFNSTVGKTPFEYRKAVN